MEEIKKKKVSFDFDDTLSETAVQAYAQKLIERGYEVWIVTTRYEDPNRYYHHVTHNDIERVKERLGITNIHFNNMEYKYKYFKENDDFLFHLDDNPDEGVLMKEHDCKTPFVSYSWNWGANCEKILNSKTDETKRKN